VRHPLLRIHRLEYPFPIHYLCYAVWGLFYAPGNLTQLLKLPVLLVFLANLIHPMAMNALNCAADTRTDARNPRKRDLAQAATRIGVGRVAAIALAELVLCFGLCAVAAVLLHRPLVAVTMAAIVALHLLYNLEPIHLKRRGLFNPIALGASFGFLPCILSHSVVTPLFAGPTWLIYSGLGLSVTAGSLWWMVPDRAADAASTTTTAAVRYGAARMARLSCGIALAVPLALSWGLWLAYSPFWGILGAALAAGWFGGQLTSLRTFSLRSYADLRRRSMTPMMVANVAFAVVPLVAR